MRRLENKVALVTGAARGQGRAHAVRLAEEGADIIAIDICADILTTAYSGSTTEDLKETVDQVESLGRRVVAECADVRDVGALQLVLDRGVATFGRLDIVCANAGIFSGSSAATLTDESWSEMIGINLTGVFNTCHAAIPHMVSSGHGGSIVLTSSVAGLRGVPNMAAYVAAKHGVVGLMRSLALELGEHRIRVNSIHPSQVNTPMIHNDAMYRLFRPDLEKPTSTDFAEVSRSFHPLQIDWVEPIDVSNAVVFLSSEEARYITGVALPVDGGATIR